MNWDLEKDIVIVGSGAGSVCAGMVALSHGKDALIVEKLAKIGGSTAYSGGIVWVPCNRFLGEEDSFAKARTYLDAVVGDIGRVSTPAIRDAYVREARNMIAFLEANGIEFEPANAADYYSGAPGAAGAEGPGRGLISPLFNIKALGEWAGFLARFEAWPPVPIKTNEYGEISLIKRHWRGKWMALKLGLRILGQKCTGKDYRGAGNGLQGQLFKLARDNGLAIWREAPLRELVIEAGRVTGIVVETEGRLKKVRARKGVLLNSGGFSRNSAMRMAHHPPSSSVAWTVANPGDTGEVIEQAKQAGAAVDLLDAVLWVPSSYFTNGEFFAFHVPTDTGKPHCIVINREGRRFANEAQGYVDFARAMLATDAVPAWAVFDSRHRQQYLWGMAFPGKTPQQWLDSGYMKTAGTLADLATQCGIDAEGLAATVERFNSFAAAGRDEDFQRGELPYDRRTAGDPTYAPNPCLGPLDRPPYYAVQLWPGDVGTQGGLVVDEFARVLKENGDVIEGLYAAGNCTASMMGRGYPGPGASVGKALTFSYIAVRHALGMEI